MIHREEIDDAALQLQVSAADIERDYVFGWLLVSIFAGPLGSKLVLKGGNALRKGYFPNTRYSSDLDFATSGALSINELRSGLLNACDATSSSSGVVFRNDEAVVREKSRVDRDLEVIEARLYFNDFYGKPGHVHIKVRIDVTQFEQLHLDPVRRLLVHPYSDAQSCPIRIVCVRLEEILASKLKCLLQRRHVADLFDYAYWLFFGGEQIDTSLVLKVFLQKTIYGDEPRAALELLLGLPSQILREAWSRFIVCPLASRLDFESSLARFAEHLQVIFAPYPSSPYRIRSQTFFPSALRNVILEAGSRMVLIRATYKGSERFLEPYSLRYKRRKDGIAREYFYAHDRTDYASHTSIKSLVADAFDDAAVTEIPFDPQFDVEVSKAGDVELSRHLRVDERSRALVFTVGRSIPFVAISVDGYSRIRSFLPACALIVMQDFRALARSVVMSARGGDW